MVVDEGGMGRAVAITRTDVTAEELRCAARHSRNGRQSCRLLAVAMVLEGASRADAAEPPHFAERIMRSGDDRENRIAEGVH